MALEAIEEVKKAEEAARERLAQARQDGEAAVLEAERAGKKALEQARIKADEETKALMKAADSKTEENARLLADSIANKKAALRARAESRMDAASLLIMERIVGAECQL